MPPHHTSQAPSAPLACHVRSRLRRAALCREARAAVAGGANDVVPRGKQVHAAPEIGAQVADGGGLVLAVGRPDRNDLWKGVAEGDVGWQHIPTCPHASGNPPSPYLWLGCWRVQAGIILVVTGGCNHHHPHLHQPAAASVQRAAVGPSEGQQHHRRCVVLSLQRRLDELQAWGTG